MRLSHFARVANKSPAIRKAGSRFRGEPPRENFRNPVVGVSGTLPSGTDGLSLDKWTAGPALGFVNSSSKQYSWGLFVQTFFSFAGNGSAPDVGLINVQPIYTYQLGAGRSLSFGNSAIVYDTERSRWASLLASVNYGQVVSFWGHKWRPNVEVGYDFKDDPGNAQWVIRAGIALLLPK